MAGSGTAAVDSMIASLPHQDARVLALDNGVYGDRMAQMCAQYRIADETLRGDWLSGPDVDKVAARLVQGDRTHLAAVAATANKCLHGVPGVAFVIYAGQGDLSRTLFRISTMGEITPADIRRLLECFR